MKTRETAIEIAVKLGLTILEMTGQPLPPTETAFDADTGRLHPALRELVNNVKKRKNMEAAGKALNLTLTQCQFHLNLLKLTDEALKLVHQYHLPEGALRTCTKMPDAPRQIAIIESLIAERAPTSKPAVNHDVFRPTALTWKIGG